MERIVLIGPLKAGKSTAGKLLAEALGWPFSSLDRLEQRYTVPAGFDPEYAKTLGQAAGDWARYSYRRRFFAAAVCQFLADHPAGVLELGGGHPILPEPADQRRVEQALAACQCVILLVPSDDRGESIRLLNSRLRPAGPAEDWNRHFLKDDRFWRLATHVVHTAGRLPAETVEEIRALLPYLSSP